MEPRYYDAAGNVDYDALVAYAVEMRREAIDVFWAGLLSKAALVFAILRASASHLRA